MNITITIDCRYRTRSLLIPAGLMVTMLWGCAHVNQGAGFSQVEQVVSERLGQRWNLEAAADAEVAEKVHSMLEEELSIDAAVEIALLNNRGLQAAYAELGIARADLVQAGLLDNPAFSGAVRFSGDSGGGTELELDVVQDFVHALMLPARKKLAAAQFEETRLRVSALALDFAAKVRSGYYALQGAEQVVGVLHAIAEADEVSFTLAQKLYEAGNISDLELATRQDLYELARVELARSEVDVVERREALNVLMGLWGRDTQWQVPERLPDLPAGEVPFEHLESLAVSQRLDLAAAGKAVEARARAVGLERNWRWMLGVEVGVSAERREHEGWAVGPVVGIELPLFDRHQAGVARREAELRRSEEQLTALAVQIRAAVRTARNRLLFARDLVQHYQEVIIPLRERIVALSQERYNFMLSGAFELLTARKGEIAAYRAYVEAVQDYWIARTELERVMGGRLAGGSRSALPEPRPVEPEKQEHHHDHGGH